MMYWGQGSRSLFGGRRISAHGSAFSLSLMIHAAYDQALDNRDAVSQALIATQQTGSGHLDHSDSSSNDNNTRVSRIEGEY
jgi:hypothetical protein